MSGKEVLITYLSNSGFSVEIGDRFLLFDYFLDIPIGESRELTAGVVSPEDFATKKSVTVFVSHSHYDHFNAKILRWRHKRQDINYILSNDINMGKYAIHLAPGDVTEVSGMKISAFPSSDDGVCYLVEVDGVSIFHAGDLNLWYRKLNSTEEKNSLTKFAYRKAKFAFLYALKSIQGHKIDIAFFPLDPRIGPGYEEGAIQFVKIFHPKLIVPMHFSERFDVCEALRDQRILPEMEVFRINKRGQQYVYHD